MSSESRYSRIARRCASETRRCGPDCQRRVSCDGSPPPPRTFTAKPRRTLRAYPRPRGRESARAVAERRVPDRDEGLERPLVGRVPGEDVEEAVAAELDGRRPARRAAAAVEEDGVDAAVQRDAAVALAGLVELLAPRRVEVADRAEVRAVAVARGADRELPRVAEMAPEAVEPRGP